MVFVEDLGSVAEVKGYRKHRQNKEKFMRCANYSL
jgi:hypothetical protein